ncbi:MAG: phosphodiester glycosidase family protein [Armatimonadota bacterium]
MAKRRSKPKTGAFLLLFLITACIAGLVAHRPAKKPPTLLDTLDHCSIIIDLAEGDYKVAPALANTAEAEHFDAMMRRIKPVAAITGTYHNPDYLPIGDILIDGKLVHRGYQRQGIGITSSGKIVFRQRHGSSRIDWAGCRHGIACGPRLLRDGKVAIDVVADGFSEAASSLKAARCAVGANAEGHLIMLAVRQPITLQTLAEAMAELGAVDAINMDGGSLCAFYADNRCLIQPILPVSNVLAVYKVK